ncbi:hypothetical protein [Streptomyces sp. NPDC048106]|uniref:hypothetical protein n=1 Tax=Streptomyces sp. NPDC048106 TaxID=3155750 RepID=UPI003453D9E0
MFSRKKTVAVFGLVGGLALASAGLAHAAGDPGTCVRDAQGAITCTQHIEGEIPENGVVPHQENCMPTKPSVLPAALGSGTSRIGPAVTCAPLASRAPQRVGTERETPDQHR